MKKSHFLIFLILMSLHSSAQRGILQDKFILNGELIGTAHGYIYLISYDDQNQRQRDSCKITNGKFKFTGVLRGFSDKFYLKLDPEMKKNNDSVNSVNIFLDNSELTIRLTLGQFSKYELKGCKSCKLLELYEKRKELQEKKGMGSTKIDFEYSRKNLSSPITPYILYWTHNRISEDQYDAFISVYDSFSIRQKKSFYGVRILQKVEEYKNVKKHIGLMAPVFSGVGLNNESISLDSLRQNKYVLLDFWASWCAPCRAENGDLLKIYSKYKAKGFEILGISDDTDEAKWRKAILTDSIHVWQHILFDSTSIRKFETLSGTSNEYYIQTLPTKILIAPDGKIIGRYDFDEKNELTTKLKEIFKF